MGAKSQGPVWGPHRRVARRRLQGGTTRGLGVGSGTGGQALGTAACPAAQEFPECVCGPRPAARPARTESPRV